jgi:hypothetical protein
MKNIISYPSKEKERKSRIPNNIENAIGIHGNGIFFSIEREYGHGIDCRNGIWSRQRNSFR